MSEANPNGQRDNSEITSLIRELELQIESVNTGLNKIRGTVARITFAVGSSTPGQTRSVGALEPANRADWAMASTPVDEAPATPEPVSPTVSSPPLSIPSSWTMPALGSDFATPEIQAEEKAGEVPGFWTSVAEGASWPRAHADAPVEPAPVPDAPSEAGFQGWELSTPEDTGISSPTSETLDDAVAARDSNEIDVWGRATAVESSASAAEEQPGWMNAPTDSGLQAWPVEAEKDRTAAESVLAAEDTAAKEPVVVAPDEPAKAEWEQASKAFGAIESAAPAAGAPDVESPRSDEKPTTDPAHPLATGWPDESAWSQSFEWPAMKAPHPQSARPPAPSQPESGVQDAQAAVNEMVARMRAELESGAAGVRPAAEAPEAAPAFEPETRASEESDEARREEVSRAVDEIRRQMAAGEFKSDDAEIEVSSQTSDLWTAPELTAASSSDEDVRDEVRRAVEAAREEMAGGQPSEPREKPAFRLAAPGSIPDWSHVQMEPSGPPVVVLKDVDGRVELASVYETLNELGCGDGAALLNYTPHSVTVGLPITAKFPSKEQVASAVEKVFGLASQVDSDGVRITVSIGVNPKRKSEDAA